MVNKYSLGGIVLGIFLLAIMGIRSASNWLTQNNAQTTTQDRIVSINPEGSETGRRSQSNQVISQADGQSTTNSADLAISPLEEAGTYIQRQKRVELDPIIANTPVDVISNTVSAQSDTTVNPQPPATTTTPTSPQTNTTTTTAQPASPAPASPAVPALW